jgi:hypothetical protein
MELWRSWCARAPEEGEDSVRFREVPLILKASMVQRNGHPPVTGKTRVQLPIEALYKS